MAKLKKLTNHDAAFVKTMKSAPVSKKVREFVEEIARKAGPGHAVEVKEGRTRTRGTVTTVTRSARSREAKDKNLTRAGHSAVRK